jgi:hypothetical protein
MKLLKKLGEIFDRFSGTYEPSNGESNGVFDNGICALLPKPRDEKTTQPQDKPLQSFRSSDDFNPPMN